MESRFRNLPQPKVNSIMKKNTYIVLIMILSGFSIMTYAQAADLVPPIPYAPEDTSTIMGATVIFKWYILEDAFDYQLQVAHDEQFKRLVLDDWVGDVELYVWNGLTESNQYYYWRIRGRVPSGLWIYNTDWSPVQWFFSPKPAEGEIDEGEGEIVEGEGEQVEGEGETPEGEGETVEGEGEGESEGEGETSEGETEGEGESEGENIEGEGEPVEGETEGEGEIVEGEGETVMLADPVIRSAPETGAVVESEVPGYYFLLVECYLLEEGETLRLQVAHDDAFTKLIYNQGDIPEARTGYTILEEGTYYWRIRRENEAGAFSNWVDRSLTVMFAEEVDEGEAQEGEDTKPPQKLTVYISPLGSGEVVVSPEMPSDGYPYGTEVVLTATPTEGFKFKRWDTTGSSEPTTDPVLKELMKSEVLVSAVFESSKSGCLGCDGCNEDDAEEEVQEKFRRILGDWLLIGLSLVILLAMRQPSR